MTVPSSLQGKFPLASKMMSSSCFVLCVAKFCDSGMASRVLFESRNVLAEEKVISLSLKSLLDSF
jgi:hypothetical protein